MRELKYELKNILGNPATTLFGYVLPIFLGALISIGVTSDVPNDIKKYVGTSVILSISIIIPLSLCLIGYSALYAQEVEKNIPLRLRLFGISERKLFKGKVLSQVILVTVGAILYFIVMNIVTDFLIPPSTKGLIRYIIIMLIISGIFVAISHGLSNILKKFGLTYGIVMGLYFLMMFLGGMMGPRYENFPPLLKRIADLLPTTIFGKDSYYIWTNETYNWGSMIQSMLFLGGVAVIILIVSIKRDDKGKL